MLKITIEITESESQLLTEDEMGDLMDYIADELDCGASADIYNFNNKICHHFVSIERIQQ
jgi:hypothetical protein